MNILDLDRTNHTIISGHTDNHFFESKLLVWEDFIVGIYLSLICLFAAILNLLVIYTCLRNWASLTRQDFYIINLACSDLLMPVSGFPLSISSSFQHKWLYGSIGCVAYGFLGFYFGLVSIITLTIMGLARYIKICHPHIDISRNSFSRATVVFPYVYAFIWSAIPLAGWGSYSHESYGTSCTLQWADNRVYITLMSACCIATPAISIISTYGLILLKCRRSSKNLREWKRTTNKTKMSTKESYLIKMTFAMCWGFLGAWMPYAVVSMWTAYGNGSLVPTRLTLIAVLLAKSSTVVNPIIYCLLSNKFRPLVIKALTMKTASSTFFAFRFRRQNWECEQQELNATDRSGSSSKSSFEDKHLIVVKTKEGSSLSDVQL